MECRINAEDPFRGFLPSTGRLVKFQPPTEIPGQVRVDTGVYDGGEISMFYDSMIAKLIVHGATREQAIARMRDALNAFVIRGISSNIPFQAALMQHPRFQSGNFNTGFIAEEYPKGFDASMVPHDDPALLVSVAAYVYRMPTPIARAITGQLQGHERIVGDHWCVVRLSERQRESHGRCPPDCRRLPRRVQGREVRDPLRLEARRICCSMAPATARNSPAGRAPQDPLQPVPLGHPADFMVMSARAAELLALMPEKPAPDLSKFLLSPMPGLLREVAVKVGQEVKAGEKLAVIEAMKMENILKADQDCKVKKVVAAAGESLTVDQVIIEFE
jgi:propionyl-CoA carboxylase alpha chain